MTANVKEKADAFAKEQEAAVAVREATKDLVVKDAGGSMLMDPARFAQAQRVANLYASSDLVPKHFQNKPSNCFVALKLADRLQVDEFMLMQNLYVVHGRPGMQATLVIALVNQRGPFTGPIQWRFEGEGVNRSCTAFATLRKTGKTCEATITWSMVVAEGWNRPKGGSGGKQLMPSKWTTMATQMFQYRSAAFLVRLYCPEVMLGLQTIDEAEDLGNVITATLEPDPEPGNADVPAFSTPPASEEPPTPAEPPASPVQTPEASPTPPVATGAAYSLDELIAEAERVGIAGVEFDGWLKTLGITTDKRTHKGKRHVENLEKLSRWIEEWGKAMKDEPFTPDGVPDEPKASKEQVSELFGAVLKRFEKDSEPDVLSTVQALLGYPDTVGAIDDLTEVQAQEAIAKCNAPNGQGQGQLV